MASGRPTRPIPDGFATDAARLPRKALRAKYAAGASTIARWKEELSNPGHSLEHAANAVARRNRLEMRTCNWRNSHIVRAW
jgi:hypothetical protein